MNLTFLNRKRRPFKPSTEPYSDELIVDSRNPLKQLFVAESRKKAASSLKENPLPILSDQFKRNADTVRVGGRRGEENFGRGAQNKTTGPLLDYQKSSLGGFQIKT